jgi:hypothetical protein
VRRSLEGPPVGRGALTGAPIAIAPFENLSGDPTPPFAEYTSGHSGFSAASATVLSVCTGSPLFGAGSVFPAGSSTIEPGATPATDVTLHWRTFADAADEAGLSRRDGGIHFRQADLESRHMGRLIGRQAWDKALEYFTGAGRRVSSALDGQCSLPFEVVHRRAEVFRHDGVRRA